MRRRGGDSEPRSSSSSSAERTVVAFENPMYDSPETTAASPSYGDNEQYVLE
jgi:hypothetical protein